MDLPSSLASPNVRSRRAADGVTTIDATSPGTVLGPWQLTGLVHQGERLTLFRARPSGDQFGPGCYVVKTARAGSRRDALALAMLQREAAVADDVSHPNLVATLGADPGGPQPLVVLPYLEGVSLRRLLNRRDGLGTSSALWIARQLASALAALHAAGWLHDQVRPEHVVVAPQGQATLIDLCQTRRLGTEECSADFAAPLSAAYAPPEAFGRGRLTPASDVYRLGIVIFELLTGRLPFDAGNTRQWADCHRRELPPDVRRLNAAVPQTAADLVRRMLAKEPLRRPAATELVDRLAGMEIEALITDAYDGRISPICRETPA